MDYIGNVIRPPSEADSIILQVAVGCPYNRCSFCGAYRDVEFQLQTDIQIQKGLQWASRYCRRQRRVFLADGDVLALPSKKLLHIFTLIREKLPWVRRISLYGSSRAVRGKSVADLQELKKAGLDRIYMGLESGSDTVLKMVCKGETAAAMIAGADKINHSNIFLSVTALLGLGGRQLAEEHALRTAAVLGRMQPRQIALLTLMVLGNTPLAKEMDEGRFVLPEPPEILDELALIIDNVDGVRCQFHANHASSYLPLAGRLPRDRDILLGAIAEARAGRRQLQPEHRRAL